MSYFKDYYITRKENEDGVFEIHEEDCPNLPGVLGRYYLGYFKNCKEAQEKAYNKYDKVAICVNCEETCFEKAKPKNTKEPVLD